MLRRLYIKNFTLIDELDVEFRPGFSVVTGETGAGKSIILGAMGLLLGQRADQKMLKQGADRCVVEAHFDLSAYAQMETFFRENDLDYDAGDTIVRRELTAAGKSRSFVNDTPVALAMLRDLGERLMDVHSQHQNLLLGRHDFQLQVVDTIAADGTELADYAAAYADYEQAVAQWQQLAADIERDRQQADFLRFQADELTAAQLQGGELEQLETQAETMAHAEDIKQALYQGHDALEGEENGAVAHVRQAAQALGGIEHVFPQVGELRQRLDSCYIELKDVAAEVGSQLEDVDFNPAELDGINARLDRIYTLLKKYRAETVEELMAMQRDMVQKLDTMENGEAQLDELKRRAASLRSQCERKAAALTKRRTAAAREIERQMKQRLSVLGMPLVRFSVELHATELQRQGCDKVDFRFSANSSTALQSIAQVASGGEIARVMLALKAMISGAVKLPTIVFDEIDTGVSGKIAEQMGLIMQQMGEADRQVISITHLPQIAARGTTHYKVFKEETPRGTVSRMVMLSPDERVVEIAQMLSGEAVGDAAIQNAKELLKI